ncbi:MAG: alpha/beta fold hydrolase [Pseudomonadota bacterium]
MQTISVKDFGLASGEVLPEMTVAYRTLGRLDPGGTNAVLVLHGYTTGPAMLDAGANVAEGSWSDLVGPGKAIDSDRHFVICPNMLGSSYGSTGPGSRNPATGKHYGLDFPRITLEDIVNAQKALLDALGVNSLEAVAGPSFGAYQAFQWAVGHPSMVRRVVAAVGAPYNPGSAGSSQAIVDKLAAAPGWENWREHGDQASMLATLTAMRIHTLTTYGVDAELTPAIPDPAERAARIAELAREWAMGFNPGSLVTLMQAAESFDLRPRLAAIEAPVMLVMSRTDAVFSPALARELASIPATRNWSYVELDSEKGHFASGADAALWADQLHSFMNTEPAAWIAHGLPLAPTPESP